ncbi:ATP-binding cassette domain-containing protein [Helicobacter sp. 11S02629-2]|uniref:methionine ABC transporter ATP-binding protein n=1 Tax=Helicobacter sp. 11S02629-2 TaxID=1476195 RepID=UPI000BA58282|nr:ATP-binding cassette domain-containing protein [Helicobacter sp. 11S02629-2]PAF43521.1 methionine ABC transporter ATP-binding protein [Helicobacter sp. 11S02629-2]
MISIKNVYKTYDNGFEALKDINLEVQKGDIFGIIGYSGAGKSTLIRLLNALELPTSGEVLIDGINIASLDSKNLQLTRQKIGMIFQHFNLLSSRNVYSNIAYALEIAGWKRSDIKVRVNELLGLVGLSEKKDSYIKELSGGQKQRVAIARALANHPKVLLCDEATSALDSKTTKDILELLRDLQARLGLTIVLITHQIEVIKEICNKMCVISAGKIVESGDVISIFAKASNKVTKELLGYEDELEAIKIEREFIYRVVFTGPKYSQPLISQAIKHFDIEVNIISGHIDELRSKEIGHLVLEIKGKEANLALAWLKEQGLEVEKAYA